MRPLSVTFLIAAVSLLVVASTASAGPKCPKVTPGKSIGPISLGMSKADLVKTGLKVKARDARWVTVGPFEAMLKKDKVVSISADSTRNSCMLLGKNKIKLDKASLTTLAAAAPTKCGPIQINLGATLAECEDGLSLVSPRGALQIRVTATTRVETVCDAWVEPGAPKSKLASANVAAGKNVCVDTRVFTSDLTPSDVVKVGGKAHISTCKQVDSGGATLLNCSFSGIRLIFSGPKHTLQRIQSIKLRK